LSRGDGQALPPVRTLEGVPRATTTLPAQASSVPTARRWAESVLESWGFPEAGWHAAQIVSELATNCTLHARSDFAVALSADAESIRLEVSDGSPIPPQRRQYTELATTGRGLTIVEALAVSWGVEARPEGKSVWAVLRADGQLDIEDLDARSAAPERGPRPSTGDVSGERLLLAA
jgi:anti-sigma regulatory factor (Ser/Thr protein kinase)